MAPDAGRRSPRRALALALALAMLLAPRAEALRIVNYNITNYPGTTGPSRDLHLRTILAPLAPDVVVLQEMQSQAGVDEFRNNVLNVIEPGAWASAPFTNGNDTDNALFYRTATVQFLGGWPFYPNPANLLRYVNCYRLKPVGYTGAAAEIRIYSQHLKASQGFEAQRLAEATGIRDSMNAMPPGTHAILTGDFNIYTGAEPAFIKLREAQADNDGRLYDPLDAPASTWNTASLARLHTQSPCLSGCTGGFATGGLDDRFDMFLPTHNLNDGEGLDLLADSYKAIGNDSLHYNKNITDAPTIREGAAYAAALFGTSDHLPIRVDLQLPAKLGAPPSLALGTVIAGAGVLLGVSNVAVMPADELTYSLTAPAGFAAPGGTHQLDPGAAAVGHVIATTPGPAGPRAGTLIIASDDPDRPAHEVALTATVVDHAVPSLDSLVASYTAAIDFGTHAPGGFEPRTVGVHNLGYDAHQARLALQGASLAGGGGRFAIAGGFAPLLVAETGARIEVGFDAAGATADSTYEATLTFSSADERIPGALPHADLVVTLRATPGSGAVTVGDPGPLGATRLHAPFPNPLQGASTVRFDLERPSRARVEVFDLEGRRVALLADRDFDPGRHALAWDGRDGTGRAAEPGLYFVRLSGAGIGARTARLIVVH